MAHDLRFERMNLTLRSLGVGGGTPAYKISALSQIVEYWHGPIRREDGIPASELAGITMPPPLHWWYCWAGRRSDIMSGQNWLLTPGAPEYLRCPLQIKDGRLLFYLENQSCYYWATSMEGCDPPVFGRDGPDQPWDAEGVSLFEHLILVSLFEITLSHNRYGACSCNLGEAKFKLIRQRVPELPIGPWRWCDMTFHAGSGVVMTSSLIGEHEGEMFYSVWLSAKSSGALDFLKPLIGPEWDRVEL